MARLSAAKKQALRDAKATTETVALGREPQGLDLSDGMFRLINAYNWHTYVIKNFEDVRKYVAQRARSTKDTEMAEAAKKIADHAIPHNFAFKCRLLEKECKLSTVAMESYKTQRDELLRKYAAQLAREEAQKAGKPKLNLVSVKDDPIDLFIGDIEEKLDQWSNEEYTYDFGQLIRAQRLRKKDLKILIEYYERLEAELAELVDGNPSEDLLEGWSHWQKRKQRRFLRFVRTILDPAREIINLQEEESANKPKRTRKKKVITPEQLTAGLKYLDQDADLEVKSQDAVSVIGSKVMWTWNPKYKQLAYYKSDEGLSVKGQTILNATTAKAKRLRNPEQFWEEFRKAPPARRFKLFNELKTKEQDSSPRFNANTLIYSASDK